MTMDEASARRVLLVQAIETLDTGDRLLKPMERQQVERALQAPAAADPAPGREAQALAALLARRAEQLLALVATREPRVAALQQPAAWTGWLVRGLPALTLLGGLLTDRIADPHRVDLLSPPLLAILLWNLLAYLLLLAAALRPRRPQASTLAAGLGRWMAGRGAGGAAGRLRRDIALRFLGLWQPASAALQRWRVARTLHLAAAGWAAGVVLSLIARGAVVEYRVGWESTWFDAAQVHAFLQLLLMPAVTLLGVAPLSLQEVAQLELGRGGGAPAGRRWVALYGTLLVLWVILPRLLLAGAARWRERRLGRAVALDMAQPYFQTLAARLEPAQVQLAVCADNADDLAALRRGWLAAGPAAAPGTTEVLPVAHELARTGDGDCLRWLELAARPSASQPPLRTAGAGWLARLRRAWPPGAAAAPRPAPPPPIDLVLQVVSHPRQLETSAWLRRAFGRPVLLLVRPVGPCAERETLVAACRAAQVPGAVEALSFDDFAACWAQEEVLLDAVARHLAPAKAPGFARLRQARSQRHQLRLAQAMATIALQLRQAARETEPVRSPALSLRDLLPAERRAAEQARQAAMAQVVRRLRDGADLSLARLLELHGVDPREAQPLEMRLEEKFVVQGAVNTPQAGLAGAATGAAMGVSVDLVLGGLTLGAATALGALVGGGAASVAAAWKNKSTGSVPSTVALGDEMLQALTEAAMLRYLAVAHFGRAAPAGSHEGVQTLWQSEVAAVVGSHGDRLAGLWAAARTQPAGTSVGEGAAPIAGALENIARELLRRLYPTATRAGIGRAEIGAAAAAAPPGAG